MICKKQNTPVISGASKRELLSSPLHRMFRSANAAEKAAILALGERIRMTMSSSRQGRKPSPSCTG